MRKDRLTMMKVWKSDQFSKQEKMGIVKGIFKQKMLGSREHSGFLIALVKYVLLIGIGFVYIYPLLYMFVTSIMSLEDLIDTSIKWIPNHIHIENYVSALNVMKFKETLFDSFYIPLIPTVIQVVVCSTVGYGFARYEFRFKNALMAMMIFSFIIPPQITMMPTYVMYTQLHLLGSMKAFIIPALFGQGFKSAIFILIFFQFYRQVPQSLLEAAHIDGAGHLRSYLRIAIPSAIPAIIVVFLFSFIWYYNETYLIGLYLNGSGAGQTKLTTMLIQLQQFEINYNQMYPLTENSPNRINEAIRMAGTMISIAPLLLIYFVLQRHFVESVDRTGITGE